MKKQILLSVVCCMVCALTTAACGGDDDAKETTLPVPQLVSTTPVNGATDVVSGSVAVAFVYDISIALDATKVGGITATECSVTGVRAAGNTLSMTAICPLEGGRVTISIPAGVVTNTQRLPAPAATLSFTVKAPAEPNPGDFETAAAAVKNMAPGWNLGNSLDAYSSSLGNNQSPEIYEKVWGQPLTDAHLMLALKEKGFNGIRIPVTWYQHMDESGRVDEPWMSRVQEVVDYVINAGMYCILNVHHDTGAHDEAWVRANATIYDNNHERFASLWRQIAERFVSYGDHLLFEGYNEMLDNSFNWTRPRVSSDLQYTNRFAQDFVDAVRSTGGNNKYRNLVVTTYSAAHGSDVLSGLVIPTDPCGNQSHIAVEVHSYDPWDWVNTYKKTWTAACTKVLQDMFVDLNTHIISKGYPVIVGEYGSNGNGEVTINGSSSTKEKGEAGRQAADMSRLCRQYGAASFYWMGIIEGKDRAESTFRWTMEQVADSIVKVYR